MYKGTLVNTEQFKWHATEHGDPETLFGMALNSPNNGQYNLLYLDENNVVQALTNPYVPAIDDKFEFYKYGNTIQLIVFDAGGTLQVDLTQVLTSNVLSVQSVQYIIDIDNGSTASLKLCAHTAINHVSPIILSATKHVTMQATFSILMRHYLGFDEESYEFDGDPAQLEGENQPKGLSRYPGVMISIRGLDLESYSGFVGKTSTDTSFLGVTRLQDNFTTLDYKPNNATMLDMRNYTDVNIRNLSVSFIQDNAGQKQLEYYGQPVVVLEIHEPEDD